MILTLVMTGRIENTEVRHMGQAFRLGRYAIHFHLSGSMAGSYVRNCAIHHSNNRALTAHGVHDLLIEGNVAYHIMGHTFFVVGKGLNLSVLGKVHILRQYPFHFTLLLIHTLHCIYSDIFQEDGIETNNMYLNNLGVLTLGSSSLLNTDQIPAVFWITNPQNTFRGNAAAASRAYGFW